MERTCGVCGRSFSSARRLSNHVSISHPSEKASAPTDDLRAAAAAGELAAQFASLAQEVRDLRSRVSALERQAEARPSRIGKRKRPSGAEPCDAPRPARPESPAPTARAPSFVLPPGPSAPAPPPPPQRVVPVDKVTSFHLGPREIAHCVKDFEFTGFRKLAKLVYFNDAAPQFKCISMGSLRERRVNMCVDGGRWESFPHDTAMKRIVRELIMVMNHKLDDDDLVEDLVGTYGIARPRVKTVVSVVESLFAEKDIAKLRPYFSDLWCLITDEGRRASM
jgi:hypothetical protein